jgi:hypothetical protein
LVWAALGNRNGNHGNYIAFDLRLVKMLVICN